MKYMSYNTEVYCNTGSRWQMVIKEESPGEEPLWRDGTRNTSAHIQELIADRQKKEKSTEQEICTYATFHLENWDLDSCPQMSRGIYVDVYWLR